MDPQMKIAWLFPGQGSQEVGMGAALCESSAAARAVFDRADAALGFSIRKLCFEGPIETLTLTENAQPAIVTTSIAVLAALREAWSTLPDPSFALGHSLGEYSALVAAGALALEDAVKLVHLRGRAMQAAVPQGQGAMAAVMGGDEAAVRALCQDAAQGETISPANFNAPGQIVISGAASAVARARDLAGGRGLKAIPLKVSAPFHSALMAPAARAVETALSGMTISKLAFPVVANVDARPNQDEAKVKELLVRQIDAPVRWAESIAAVAEAGVTKALELGPGKVLAGLVKRTDKRIAVFGCSDPDGVAATLGSLGA
jgi:[acyl-carrier-protein] S-malonyltransferase